MGTGIMLCGLNGTGKSTLGKALAQELHYHFIDNEDLYFPKTSPDYLYASPRTRREVEELLFREIKAHENFLFASVKGDYGKAVYPYFQYAILLTVPREIRLQRIRNRSFEKFGDRMLPGGDLYEREERFFQFAAARDENTVEEWLRELSCPILRADGTRPVRENVALLLKRLPL
ncbi:MAG: AAA family ATPase [Roseburia sp.]|nr:AAA family ATPase [Roseburia sp.]MCM1098571.1 AAA family ATPase [Ruminococcus flavefaciens]